MEAGGVGTNLRPKTSTSVSVGDSCWKERFLRALILKFVWSSCRICCVYCPCKERPPQLL